MKAKTKIVATLGPSSDTYEVIKQLADEGVDLVRINMSHGTYKEHEEKIKIVERLRKEGYPLAIMMDLKGPKIRCGCFENGGVEFVRGDITRIVKEDVIGNKERFSISYKNFYNDINVGNKFTFDDGILGFEVISKEDNEVLVCKALNDHVLKDKKGLNAPYVKLFNEYISEVDKKDIEFACTQKINYLAASFVRTKDDLLAIKELLKKNGREDLKIVAKIESPEGVANIDDIIANSNAIMVARGDLGVEVELVKVPQIQKELIKKCNLIGKPVIVATHMLESMQANPTPTRAEVSDVFNAILDGADAVMLSGESANGKYPIEAVKMQNDIALHAEEILDYERYANEFYEFSNKSQGDAIGISIAKSILILDAKLVVAVSSSFHAMRKLAKFKFKVPVLAVVDDEQLAIDLNGLYYGIEAICYKKVKDKEKLALKLAKEYHVKEGEYIIFVGVDDISKKSNMMKILKVM